MQTLKRHMPFLFSWKNQWPLLTKIGTHLYSANQRQVNVLLFKRKSQKKKKKRLMLSFDLKSKLKSWSGL